MKKTERSVKHRQDKTIDDRQIMTTTKKSHKISKEQKHASRKARQGQVNAEHDENQIPTVIKHEAQE
jgi:hypothetical protein